MRAKNLMDRFRKAIQNPKTSSTFANDESVTILDATDWVRILLVRESGDSSAQSVEIEVAPPSAHLASDGSRRQLLLDMIKHIEYVLRLSESGFVLDVLGSDFTWTAHKAFQEEPNESFFEFILPP